MKLYTFKHPPFLFLTLPFIAGVIAVQWAINTYSWTPVILTIVACVVLTTTLKISGKKGYFVEIIGLTLLGMLFHLATDRPDKIQYNSKYLYTAQITTQPTNNNNSRYNSCVAQLISVKNDTIHTQLQNTKTMLYVDTTQQVNIGDYVLYQAKTFPYKPPYESYYRHKNIVGRQYAYRIDSLGNDQTNLRLKVEKARMAISRRIYNLRDSVTNETSLMAALVVGTKGEMEPQLKNAYRLSGVSHLLAISGLHVGIVFLLLNFMTRTLLLFKNRGAKIQLAIIVFCLLMFAVLSGLTPSVVRAVLMFIMFQIAIIFRGNSDSLNVLLASALCILLCDTKLLFDPGFQLSYLAMLGIILFYGPIRGIFKFRNRFFSWFYGLFVITFCAQLFTTPLVIYLFGQMSFSSFFIGYIVWFTMPIIIFSTLLYLVIPLNFIGEIGIYVASAQNSIIERFSGVDAFIYRNDTMPFWALLCIYIVLIVISIVMITVRSRILNFKYQKQMKIHTPDL